MKATGILNSATLTTATQDKVERSIVVLKITAPLEAGAAEALGGMLKKPIAFEISAIQATFEGMDMRTGPQAVRDADKEAEKAQQRERKASLKK